MHLTTLVFHQHVTGGGPQGSPPGVPVVSTIGLYLLVLFLGLLAAPRLTGAPVSTRLRTALVWMAGLGYAVVAFTLAARGELALLQPLHTDEGPLHLLLSTAHLVAAAVWTGGVIHLALVGTSGGREAFATAVRRFSPYAVGSAVGLAASGVVLFLGEDVAWSQVPTTAYGRIILIKSAALLLAGALGLLHRRAGHSRVRVGVLRGEALTLASAVGLAAVLTGLPATASAAVTTAGPGLVVAHVGDDDAPLYVVATSTTRALVLFGGAEAGTVTLRDRAGDAHWRPLTPGRITPVRVSAGKVDLDLHHDESTVRVTTAPDVLPVTTDPLVQGAAPSVRYALGRSLAASSASNAPQRACAAPVRSLAAAYARALHQLNLDRVRIVGDRSARSRAFDHVLLKSPLDARAAHEHSPATASDSTLLITSRGERAVATLDRLGHSAAAPRGVVLAPWLLTTDVLSVASDARLPLVAVGAAVDPTSVTADNYRATLGRTLPGLHPDVAGLLGYVTYADPTATQRQRLSLYAAAPVGFLPGVLEAGHNHGDTGWFPDGTLAAISRGVDVRTHCPDLST